MFMRTKKLLKRIGAFCLCMMMLFGNILGAYAAEETESTNTMINVVLENISAVFDKEIYGTGDTVEIILSPEEGYLIDESTMEVTFGEEQVEFEMEQMENSWKISFVLTDTPVELHAKAKKLHAIQLSYRNMYGEDGSALFETVVSPECATEGSAVCVSVNYKGSNGWIAEVTSQDQPVDYEMTSDRLSFTMPSEDVHILLQEMESYDKGDLSEEDTPLGEDIGKQHDVTTCKEYEPDVSIGKAAKWDHIEEGLATLTLTEKDTSDWSDNPSDYIIVLDRTRTMALDDACFWSENTPRIGATHSVCLNENHFYIYKGKPVKLIDYSNGMFTTDKSYFSTNGSEKTLWNAHYNSAGTRITPSLENGCLDRLTLAQKSIRDIMDVLDAQNKNELAGGLKNRVMYWSFSGPTYKDKQLHPDGLWNEVPAFTTDISAAKNAVQYQSYAGTYYNNSFEKILKEIQKKQTENAYKNIPTKVIFISDGLQSDHDKNVTEQMANQIKNMPNTKLYTILIGNGANSEAGILLKKYASGSECFATVNSSWNTFVQTITAIQKDQFEISAVNKVFSDKIQTKYWEVIGEPMVESGHGTAVLNAEKTVLTWNIPNGEGKTYTCKLKLKLKDEYRYLLSDTSYPTNLDDDGATSEDISKDPQKAGAVLSYSILGGKYNTETRKAGVETPKLKYGTLEFEGEKHWTVDGSSAERLKIILKRTMPGSTVAVEINNTTTNVTKDWKFRFQVRQMPDGSTYPLIKYNNAGEKISYTVSEELPDYYVQINQSKKETGNKVVNEFYNEPYKVKPQILKVDRETKNPLRGAEFSVYAWSAKEGDYVPYHGTKSAVSGAEEVMKLVEEERGIYQTPAWLYYAADNQGKFRIVETKAPEGYFGDWKDQEKNVYDLVISKEPGKNGEIIVLSNQEDKTFANERVKGEIHFAKLDAEAKTAAAQGEATLTGAVYQLYAAEDIVHQDGVTGILHKKGEVIKVALTANLNGKNVYTYAPEGTSEIKTGFSAEVCIKDLELGSYELREITASEGYLVSPEKYRFDLAYEGESKKIVSVERDVYERVKKQSLDFYKLTADNNSDQLDPLAGAKFSVYLVNELENGRYESMTDDEVVQAIIDDLRNPTTLLYDTYQKYQPASVYAEEQDADVLSGRLIKRVKYSDKTVYEVQEKHEYLVAELESDKMGVVKTPGLPYGRYVVIETTTPKGKTATRPFIIHVTDDEKDAVIEGDGKGTPLQDKQLVMLVDRPIMSLVRIMKRDADSKQIVLKEGASYVIHDLDGAWFDYITNEMTTAQKKAYKETYGDLVAQYSQGIYYGTKEQPFVTKIVKSAADGTESVMIETPAQLPNGVYELEEMKAPEGYILQGFEGLIQKNSKYAGNGTYFETEEEGMWKPTPQGRTRFIISEEEAVYEEASRSFVTTVKQDNEPAIGKISVYVEGEKLVSAEKDKKSGDYVFDYEPRPIAGAKFEIRAEEDIYSLEGGAHAAKIFEKGALVVTLISDENGQTWTGQEDWEGTEIAKGLPLGSYTVTQTEAGEGFYLSEENALPRKIKISYAGQEVPVIYKNISYENPRQEVKIEVSKVDAKDKKSLAGAVFGLYAGENILNDQGKVIVEADTLIAVAETKEENGVKNAVFTTGLPHGKYDVKELKAPDGYVCSGKYYEVETLYTNQNEKVIVKHISVANDKTKHLFTKSDAVSSVKLAGAKFEIWEIMTDENGNLRKNKDGSYQVGKEPVAAWTSEKEGNFVEGLAVGKYYTLKELQAPYGYVGTDASCEETKKANQEIVKFFVEETTEIVTHDVKNDRVTGKLTITKEGEFLKEAKISVIDKAKNLFKTMFLYVLGRMENVSFDIYVKEDIYTPDGSENYAVWKNSKGEVLELKANTLIESVKTDYNGIATVENLPLGKYFVKETSVGNSSNMLLNKEVKEFVVAYENQDTPVVNAVCTGEMDVTGVYYLNECQKVEITVDKYAKNAKGEKIPVQGAVFGLYTSEDIPGYVIDKNQTVKENITALIKAETLIETAESNAEGKVLFSSNLPCGKYYVKELKPAKGYLSCDEVWYVDASYTGEDGENVRKFHFEVENKLAPAEEIKRDEPVVVPQVPGTGDSSMISLWGISLGFSVAGIVLLRRKKQK